MMIIKVTIAIFAAFVACCINVIFLELIIRCLAINNNSLNNTLFFKTRFRYDPGAGNLITFSQFVCVSIAGLILTSKFFAIKRIISLIDYAILVAIFFTGNVCNNYALNLNIPMTLLLVFRSGSIMANLIMAQIILKRKYSFSKYVSVLMITIGILVCTLASHYEVKNEEENSTIWWIFGVLLMTCSLLLAARMGLFQEMLFKKYGKHPEEALFYTHILALPTFLPLIPDVTSHFHKILQSPGIEVPIVHLKVPSSLIFLIINIICHYICIKSVYFLASECSSLTVTLIVTLRKFVSLVISIYYFQNPFTFIHWLGTIFILIGTVIFTELVTKIISILNRSRATTVLYNILAKITIKIIRL
jgi:solute carrier family 35 (UDP-xylose/UDP-N-acetylglucosamine transporter), member B4